METEGGIARALFLSPNGSLVPDNLICSGFILSQLNGRACPYSDHGRMPLPRRPDGLLRRAGSAGKEAEEVVPPCALTRLGPLEEWKGRSEIDYPSGLKGLELFKCRQMFLLVVPTTEEDVPLLAAYQEYLDLKHTRRRFAAGEGGLSKPDRSPI